ncbi:hypothetical protein EPA93_19945 [Ktedonosporobacter rubrisoli]|uniref:Uncharacterized protein n=1 Tax=Ktedonosporobacter rubrisoli TaxID=2509675 RepID=A0A4P6JTB9_KTERU|nr:hypothetical protein [Ktedonosporobacter rubrisoli]QBD78146.1 hypothetical protein EPA93_19945 [Ktedonosporobacter rubrisoli]
MRRVLPAIGLYFLAPLVAEFLLGDIPILSGAGLVAFFASSLIYGSGAVLIREVVRRAGYGWPTIIAFALAYGVIEESFATLSLFNPHYAGWHQLDYGYVPALGIGLSWTLFVLGLHMIWSISVPIALVETLAGSRRTTPWLGNIGLAVMAIVFVGIVIFSFTASTHNDGFVASMPQFIGAGIAVIIIVAIGIVLGRYQTTLHTNITRNAPNPWLVLIVSLAAGALFMLIYSADPRGLSPWLANINLPPWLAVVLFLGLYAGVAVLVNFWSRLDGWSNAHRLALAGGALLTYAWHAFPWPSLFPGTSEPVKLASNTILAAGAVALLVIAALRLRTSTSNASSSASTTAL